MVIDDLLLLVPVFAGDGLEHLAVGPFEILPVVGVHALEAVVLHLRKRAELGLELEEEEYAIDLQEMERQDFQLQIRVRQRAIDPILAGFALDVLFAVLPLVVRRVVDLLDVVV